MKSKNKAQTTFISVIAMGFVLCLVMFMYYCKPTEQKRETLEASNATLATRVAELEKFYQEMPENKQRIESMTAGIKESLAIFPADVKEEDTIYLAIASKKLYNLRTMYEDGTIPADEHLVTFFPAEADENIIKYTSLNIGEPESLAIIEEKTVKGANIEGYEGNIVFNSRLTTYNNVTDYHTLKGLLQSINYEADKKTLKNIAYTIDDEGKLVGNVAVTYYWVEGTDREYVPKDFGEFLVGMDNLFDEPAVVEGEEEAIPQE